MTPRLSPGAGIRRARRFRFTLDCGHLLYVSTEGDPPQTYPPGTGVLCGTCEDLSHVEATPIEVPGIEARLDCLVCKKEARVDAIEGGTDHPAVTYLCPEGHKRRVQL